jgi:hypothetical protein
VIAQGQFATLSYTWAYEGADQDGLFLFSQEAPGMIVKAYWVDSWHMGDQLMICVGKVDSKGIISVNGSYAAPPDPDWGWRAVIEPGESSSFRLLMYNIPPTGEELLAVEAVFQKS